jgi:hypothetical protein
MTTGTPSVYTRLAAIAPRDLVERGVADGRPSSGLSRCRIER